MLSGVTSESASMLAELFRTLDKDGSSGVSATELTEATGGTTGSSASMDEIFAALDTDEDGSVSEEEFTAYVEEQTAASSGASGATACSPVWISTMTGPWIRRN